MIYCLQEKEENNKYDAWSVIMHTCGWNKNEEEEQQQQQQQQQQK